MSVAPRARMRRVVAAWLAALSLAAPGCARRPPAPVPPAPVPPIPIVLRPPPGYDHMVDSLNAIDASGLAGRRIALDPGHGGYFRGALGVNGLTEAEVNLGVALQLRDLLVARGAQVFLTRDRDRDYLSPADSALRADLAERVRLASAFAPDLFISIHHNADAAGTHDINETQTYYKLGDDGPSLDVAQDIHRALVRNVGIRPHRVVPGNYFVLRGSDAPAVLTETSYITNPDVEERLRLPEKQQLEAQALCLGIARYFARPLPVIARFVATTGSASHEETRFESGEPRLAAVIRGPFDQAELTVDGERQEPMRVDSILTFRPDRPWSGGPHEATLRVRLNGVGSTRERRLQFFRATRVTSLDAAVTQGAMTDEAPLGAVKITLREPSGAIHRDTTSGTITVAVHRLSGRGILPRDTVLVARDGVAWGYFRRVPGIPSQGVRYRAEVGTPGRSARVEFALAVREGRRPDVWTGFARRMPEGTRLRDVPATREPEPQVGWVNRDGFSHIERDAAGRPLVPRLPGYRVWGEAGTVPPRLLPIAGGVLQGRRITLDPEGGGEDPAGVGVSGMRAAHLNLETARILARLLVAAGAEVHLTRAGDLSLTDVQRVQGSETFRADRYLRIGHRARRFGYYFSSPAGRRWAAGALAAFASLGLSPPPMAEDALYPLQQTSCPALYASPARVDSAGEEEALLAPGALRAEAYALFIALAREWAPEVEWPVDSIEVRDAAGVPVPGALVTLGDALVLQTDAGGRVRFVRTESGPIEALVVDPRVHARQVLLDSIRGAVLSGSRKE